MSLLRPTTLLRPVRTLTRPALRLPAAPISHTLRLASTQSTHGAASHTQHGTSEHTGDHGHSHDAYEPPTGWLWGIPPGEQYQKEGWEGIWYWGFYGSLILAGVAYAWKPDTSIETWALEEAKRRLQAEGTLPEDE